VPSSAAEACRSLRQRRHGDLPRLTVNDVWSRRAFPVIFWGLWIAAIAAGSGALFVIAGLLTVGYGVSVAIHPRARCLRCNGTGEKRGGVFTWTFRRCPHCQGGRIVRRGAGVGGPAHVRNQYRQIKQQAASTRNRQRW
jgi:hypothetical protein